MTSLGLRCAGLVPVNVSQTLLAGPRAKAGSPSIEDKQQATLKLEA